MKAKDIQCFEKLNTQLQGLYDEMAILSKKKPDDAVNKFKLTFINSVLEKVNKLSDDQSRPFDNFSVFDESAMPTNSDVVLIFAQYLNCLEEFRSNNIIQYVGTWYWKIDGKKSSTEALPPKRRPT